MPAVRPKSCAARSCREPDRRSGVNPAVTPEARMEDLENRLSAMGYRQVRQRPECCQVSRAGAIPPTLRIPSAPGLRDPALSPVLRFWLRRLGRLDPAPRYRILRAS